MACGPTGLSTSAPSALSWKPIAVTPPRATGDCTRRFPTVASTCGSGGSEFTGSGAGRLDGLRATALVVERRQAQGHDGEDGDDDEQREPPGALLRATSVRTKPRGVP